MQEKDVIAKEYLQDPGRFADLLNAEWFQGKQVLGPEHIREKKGRSARIHRKAGSARPKQRKMWQRRLRLAAEPSG